MREQDPGPADGQQRRLLAALEHQARGDLRRLLQRAAQDRLDLGERDLGVVVAEAQDDLTAGREDVAEADHHGGGRRVGDDGPGLGGGPRRVELERVLVHEEVEGVAVEDDAGALGRRRREDGGQHGLAGEDVVASAVAEVNVAEDEGDHDCSLLLPAAPALA